MNKKQYQTFSRAEVERILTLIAQKNEDYSMGDDPFANFRISETVGVPTLTGLWIRMEDKFQRIRAFLNRGSLQVTNESIKDAFRDNIGYSLLALAVLEEKEENDVTD